MPNKKGGKKFKKGKKQSSYDKALLYKDPKEDQEYAKVIRASGNGRFDVQCFDGKDRLGVLAGNMRKKIWVNKDDIVLIGLWDFQDDKCSIIHKYAEDEVGKLIGKNEIPIGFKVSSEEDFNEEENYFDYAQIPNSSSEEEEEDEEDKDEESKKSKSSSSEEEEIDLNDI